MMNETQLFKLKKEVEEAKQEVSELKGHLTAQMKQLKEEWKCSSVEDGESKIVSMKKEISKIDSQIEEGSIKLEEMYNV